MSSNYFGQSASIGHSGGRVVDNQELAVRICKYSPVSEAWSRVAVGYWSNNNMQGIVISDARIEHKQDLPAIR